MTAITFALLAIGANQLADQATGIFAFAFFAISIGFACTAFYLVLPQ